jgi:hypothetical protein
MEKILKSGEKFKVDENTVLTVKKRHGRFFLVSVFNREYGLIVDKIMPKDQILKHELFSETFKKPKDWTKLSVKETIILKSIGGDDTVLKVAEKFPDMSRSQVAGHISILNRKGMINISDEDRCLDVTGRGMAVLGII